MLFVKQPLIPPTYPITLFYYSFTFNIENKFLLNCFIADQLLAFITRLYHHLSQLLIFNHSYSVMGFILVETLISDRFAWNRPSFFLFISNNKSILDKFWIVKTSNLFRFKRSMCCEVLNCTRESVNSNSHIIDCMVNEVLSTSSSMI